MQTAYIALGGNLASWAGPPEVTLRGAVSRLGQLGSVRRRSSLYITEPVGFSEQPRFVNAVIELETDLKPRVLLQKLLEIEKEFGRDRSQSIPNGPRTLDLDILLVGDLEVNEPGLQLPHPRITERAFVLVPLYEIAPTLRVAGRKATVGDLLQSLRKSGEGGTDGVVRIEGDDWQAEA